MILSDVACDPLSHGTVIEIAQVCLYVRKIRVKWLLKLLADVQKWNKVAVNLRLHAPLPCQRERPG